MIRLGWCCPRLCPLAPSQLLTHSGHFAVALLTTFELRITKILSLIPKIPLLRLQPLYQHRVSSASGSTPVHSRYVLGASSLGISRPEFRGNLLAAWEPLYGEFYSPRQKQYANTPITLSVLWELIVFFKVLSHYHCGTDKKIRVQGS